ncbi:MAG: histidine kinase dimerization/phospho-acceptor domain-containing protein [Pirellulaceae bacterium]
MYEKVPMPYYKEMADSASRVVRKFSSGFPSLFARESKDLMFERRSIKWPIILGVVMILLVVALTIGWVVLTVIGGLKDPESAPIYWASLSVGAVLLVCILAGVIVYLTVTVKAINLNQRQSNFIDSVTHELKSPIASLKLYLQTLGRRQVTDAQRQDFHRFMMEDVERLDNLINHLLDAARLDREAEPKPIEDCRVDEILNRCAAPLACDIGSPLKQSLYMPNQRSFRQRLSIWKSCFAI